MAEIIQKGNKHIVAICRDCGCVFSYSPYEVHKRGIYNCVTCPDCFYSNVIAEKKNDINKKEDNENV